MRSTLKKSLYLGLAALSFASVAGVANNANAAKKSHHVRHAKTYASARYMNIPSQGNSHIAYNVTGTNAMFNKPGTVKGAKQTVSKQTMSDLASAKENFMVYENATTSRNSKYIKVVSFDKKYRGWIYAGKNDTNSYGSGVNQINLSTQGTSQYNSVYLKNPGNVSLKSSPEGAQFNKPYDSFAQTGLVAHDAFNVNGAQTVSNTGTTWYHLVDQKDNTINGWIPKDQLQLSSNNNYFDKNNDIKVNYTNNGQVVKSSIVPVNDLNKRYSDSNVLSPVDTFSSSDQPSEDGLAARINNNFDNTFSGTSGYTFNKFDTSQGNINNLDTNTSANNNINAIQYVEPGDTINISINGSDQGNVASHMSFNVEGSQFTAPSALDKSSINVPSLDINEISKQLNGYDSRQQIDMNDVLGTSKDGVNQYRINNDIHGRNTNIFGVDPSTTNPTKLGVLYGGTQYAQSNITNGAGDTSSSAYSDNDIANNQISNTVQGNSDSQLNQNYTINQGHAFHYDYLLDIPATKNNNNGNYGQNIKLYYKAVPVNGASDFTTANTSTKNYF